MSDHFMRTISRMCSARHWLPRIRLVRKRESIFLPRCAIASASGIPRTCSGSMSRRKMFLQDRGKRSSQPACRSNVRGGDDLRRLDGGRFRDDVFERNMALTAALLQSPAHEVSRERHRERFRDRGGHDVAVEESLPEDERNEAIERGALVRDALDRAPDVENGENDEGAHNHPDVEPAEEA